MLSTLGLTFALISLAGGVPLSSPSLIAHVAEGPVEGTLISPSVRQFLGIPYGLAPIVARRFAPPEPLALEGDFVAGSYVSGVRPVAHSARCCRAFRLNYG